jgi:hypothetical protein
MDAPALVAALGGKWHGSYGTARCPAHEDRDPSLSVTDKGGKLLVKCHAGCTQDAVVSALKRLGHWPDGEPPIDLGAAVSANGKAPPRDAPTRIVETYDYHDEHGELLYQVVRKEPKSFPGRRPNGVNGWIYNLDGVRRVVYRLPEIIRADRRKTVFVVEGEKDVNRLFDLGLLATCNPHGAGKWLEAYNEPFRGRHVAILPDNDQQGRAHAALVARNLLPIAARVRIVELPGLPDKGDVSDWLAAGNDVAALKALVTQAPPLEAAPEVPDAGDGTEGEAATAETFPLQTLADVAALIEETGAQLLEGVIWRHRVTWAFSDPNTGKTLFLLAAGIHIAAGRPFCGRKIAQGPVLLIEEDSPFSVLGEYAAMLADIYDIDLAAIPFYVNKEQGLRITDAAGYRSAQLAVESCPQRPVYVILDAAERLVPSDRYSTKELDWLTRYLQWLMNQQITPNVIDHTRKPPQAQPQQGGKRSSVQRRPLDDLFGARAKSAISDVMLYFAGSLKTGGVQLSFEKFRGETPEPMELTFTADEGFRIISRPPSSRTPSEQQILAWFNNHGGTDYYSGTEIANRSGVKYRTAGRALQALVNRGCLVKRGKTSDAAYALNPDLPGVFQ